ncbi:MAG TPA: CRTAC1 family protein, partial [Gemmataceae bacterium]|nr:CRTAC1 family protein [Gemmataceae bacterium]
VTRGAGLDDPHWGASACFVDYDLDGWLDLVVTHYVDYDPSQPCAGAGGQRDFCHPRTFPGTLTRLYRNRGDGSARFEDVTLKAGLGKPGPGLGVTCADFNGDGWPDIFVANDADANRLWVNQKDGTFRDEAVGRGVAYNGMGQPQANMGVAVGDVAGTGRLDLFVTHLTEETHTLWRQQPGEPRGLFRDATAASGLAAPRWRGTGFGTALADFNHDGWLDIAVANGRVRRGPPVAADALGPFWCRYGERNQLFAGAGDGRFRDLSEDNAPLCGTPNVARGLAVGDVDGDGALDLLVTTAAGPARLFRNVAPDRGHWLLVRALDPELKRDAYGAEVTVWAGGRRWVSAVNPGQSYLCGNDPRAHFGLGEAAWVDRIEVRWPDRNGTREQFAGRAADQAVTLRKGEGHRP